MPAQQDQPPDKLPPVKTSITVVEHIDTETPANISVVDRERLDQIPGTDMDDRLRQIPGFSLYRRSSSLVAHPTTQGVSLRGMAASGTSRSLVLWDGIPANDPFGGWVYWTRFMPTELNRVEVSRGASTSIFGDRAMGGAIGLFTREPEHVHLDASYEGGNQDSHDVTAGFSNLWSRWAISGYGRAYTTDGYFIIPENLRGRADTRSNVRFTTSNLRLDYFGGANRMFFKTDILAEQRQNGTMLQHNSTGMGEIALHYERQMTNDSLSLLGFYSREGFRSTFSSVAPGRNTETLTYNQRVPSEAGGGAAFWQHHQNGWNLTGGGDLYRTQGYSTDYLFPTLLRVGGGSQFQHGLFVQTDKNFGPARFFLGARHSFTGQDSTFFSPSAGFVVGRKRWRARGSVYRSFRAPTLNELFRNFQQGNALTQANSALHPEKVFGAEAGLDYVGESGAVRLTFFRNSLSDLISNVTLSSSANQIIRQRQNASAALSRGAELSAEQRWRNWRGEIGYLYVDSRFSTGPRLSQVPRHQGSAGLTYSRGGTFASAGIRSYASQFDDDLNQFLLPGFTVVQLVVRQYLAKNLSASLAIENLLDRQFYTAFSPTPNVGAPRLWRIGLRWDGRLR
ncbi:MAG TPA: TonB-dependent receptor [Bryobacteraceae bacterium]|nr:TonB-dependent receptor [Bryobacteraceae bacterium]